MKHGFLEDTPERNEIERRLVLLRLFQGEEIDGAKNGGKKRNVPSHWGRYDQESDEPSRKIVSDQRPYFTRYLYDSYHKKYLAERDRANKYCWSKLDKSFDEILTSNIRTSEEQAVIDNYYKYSFFLFTPSPMNRVCWKMETELKDISQTVSAKRKSFDLTSLLSTSSFVPTDGAMKKMKTLATKYSSAKKALRGTFDEFFKKDINHIIAEVGRAAEEDISSDRTELGNLAVMMMIEDSRTKSFAWSVFGDNIIENILDRHGHQVTFPIQDDYGDIEFMFERYSKRRIHV